MTEHSSSWSCNSPKCHISRRVSSSCQAESDSSLQSRTHSWAPLPTLSQIASWHLSIHPLGLDSQAWLLAPMNSSSLTKSACIFVLGWEGGKSMGTLSMEAPWREPGRFREHSWMGGLTQQFLQRASGFWFFFHFIPSGMLGTELIFMPASGE